MYNHRIGDPFSNPPSFVPSNKCKPFCSLSASKVSNIRLGESIVLSWETRHGERIEIKKEGVGIKTVDPIGHSKEGGYNSGRINDIPFSNTAVTSVVYRARVYNNNNLWIGDCSFRVSN
ncbi:MAG: hypothetical protein KY053_01405 [Candidatus Liptonbacteria bacterium]|nr:hypothetical protein [Candidatus Liptonbacteria bacterium]